MKCSVEKIERGCQQLHELKNYIGLKQLLHWYSSDYRKHNDIKLMYTTMSLKQKVCVCVVSGSGSGYCISWFPGLQSAHWVEAKIIISIKL